MLVIAAEIEPLAPGALAERERVLRVLREQASRLRARGIARLSLFGSMARGEAKPRSDIDLLIEVDPEAGFGLSDLLDLQQELADRLGRPVERNVEIISEASRRLPAAMKARHSDAPWRDIAAIGNLLRHEYPAINRDIIWRILTRDIRPLATAVDPLLAEFVRDRESLQRRRVSASPRRSADGRRRRGAGGGRARGR